MKEGLGISIEGLHVAGGGLKASYLPDLIRIGPPCIDEDCLQHGGYLCWWVGGEGGGGGGGETGLWPHLSCCDIVQSRDNMIKLGQVCCDDRFAGLWN